MADQGQRTEKPTQRRTEKARREGRFPSSKDFVGACQFLTFMAILLAGMAPLMSHAAHLTRFLLTRAFNLELNQQNVIALFRGLLFSVITPLLLAGASLALVSLFVQLGITQFGLSTEKLAPDFSRLNPLSKLKELPAQNIPAALQGVVLLPVLAYAVYVIARDNLGSYLSLPMLGLRPALLLVAVTLKSMLWKASLVLVVFGVIDLLRQRQRYNKSLRMSKQEIREEAKESDGNPQMKGRIRKMQRDFARSVMMKNVPTATAVIVNPTHFAVAIQYDMESMSAPRVVAKGRDHLALRIRQIALEHQVPIVENPPLSRALYKSVDVGQEIPQNLYRAVAEILAYIFRLMHPRAATAGGR